MKAHVKIQATLPCGWAKHVYQWNSLHHNILLLEPSFAVTIQFQESSFSLI